MIKTERTCPMCGKQLYQKRKGSVIFGCKDGCLTTWRLVEGKLVREFNEQENYTKEEKE
jgi:ribosomal protein L37AE/L43A